MQGTQELRESIFNGLIELDRMRSTGKDALARLIERLTAEYQVPSIENNGNVVQSRDNKSQPNIIKRCSAKVKLLFNFIIKIPSYHKQWHMISEIHKSSAGIKHLYVAISFNRLNNTQLQSGFRKNLIQLSRELNRETNQLSLTQEIKDARYISCFSPELNSSLWNRKQQFWQEGVFIIDTQFLFYCSIWPSFKKAFLKLGIINQPTESSSLTLKKKLAANLIINAYEAIYDSQNHVQSYFFTSNSFVTEILRVYLLQQKNCELICEVLHGIPSKECDAYFSSILSTSSGEVVNKKHQFVAQLPHLKLDKVFDGHLVKDKSLSINSYINKFMLDFGGEKTEIKSRLFELCHKLIGESLEDQRPLIISMIGATSHDKEYFVSPTFGIELEILKQVVNFSKTVSKHMVPLYFPHPANNLSELRKSEEFNRLGIYLGDSTITSWMISDVSIGLYSTALFEAAYFGVETFTPTRLGDNIYSGTLLNMLNTVDSSSYDNAQAALHEFLENKIKDCSVKTLREKIETRLAML